MRHLFGLSPADVSVEQVGDDMKLRPGSTGTAWDALTGGTQLTDLTDLSGTPITTVTSDTNSVIGFYGPDGVTNLYLDFGFTGGRVLMQASDLGASITDLQTNKLDIAADLRSGGTITGNLSVSGRLSGPVSPYGVIAPSRNTPAWRPALISHQFQSGHGWTAQGAASSNLNNTTAFVRGTQCASITTDTAGGSANLRKFGMAAMDLTDKAIRLICRADDITKISSLNFFVGSSSLANNFKWRLWEVAATSQLGSNT
ncbi:hypothetical protein [Streptomyces avermitilis]|uniref:hypothetical protein n=1 Tax=Streptomyces avermitilis TaxID=33903 RepID=UPI0033F5C3BF